MIGTNQVQVGIDFHFGCAGLRCGAVGTNWMQAGFKSVAMLCSAVLWLQFAVLCWGEALFSGYRWSARMILIFVCVVLCYAVYTQKPKAANC